VLVPAFNEASGDLGPLHPVDEHPSRSQYTPAMKLSRKYTNTIGHLPVPPEPTELAHAHPAGSRAVADRLSHRVAIHVAEDLLSSTELGVAQVARRVGYESEEAFSRAFKRARGSSPSSWRTSTRAGERPAARSTPPFDSGGNNSQPR
jgi:AraC-like DNA-binding protein